MKLTRKARLFFREGNSDKVYEVELCDLGIRSGDRRYVVNFRYGRRGKYLREGTKTISPATLAEANEIFDSVVVSKTNKGYQESATVSARSSTAADTGTVPANPPAEDKRAQIILDRLTAAQQGAISANEIKRSVWRAGELGMRGAAPQLIRLIATDDALLDYCIAWSLGRCGDFSVIPSLNDLQQRHGLDFVGRMAREAILALAGTGERVAIYLYTADSDAWFVLDPVITVHPDEVFFECFSNDESTYARLSCSYDVFHNISEKTFGTTNIDYSDALYNEFQKLRDYKISHFHIDPGGFEVATTNEDAFTEEKIELPDSWIRGFLQSIPRLPLAIT